MTDKRDFLLEVGVEELPSSLIPSIFEETKSRFIEKLKESRLHYEDLYLVGTHISSFGINPTTNSGKKGD